MANTVGISGHTVVEDNVVFGGMTGIHQKLRVGKLAMVGGFSKIVQDVPPFSMVDGRPGRVLDINVVGLRRNNIPTKSRTDIRKAYKILYRSDLNATQALERIEKELEITPEISYLIEFIKKIRLGARGRQLETPRL
jgi:UDP-N-acetylglucosamine acyltransferase